MKLLQPFNMVEWNRKLYAGEYDSEYLRHYLGLGHQGLRVVDVGANSGGFAAWLSSVAPEGSLASYDAYEPQERLRGSIEMARAGGPVSVHTAAVTGVERLSGLVLARRPFGNAGEWQVLLADKVPEGWETQPVETVLATDLPPCEILKLDCEGPEGLILTHYPHLQGVQYLAYEWHGRSTAEVCSQAAFAAGLVPVKAVLETADRGVMCWGR